MNLIQYEGKKVRLTDIEEKVWVGKVTDYVYPEDNEPEIESIIIQCEIGRFPGKSIEFVASEIKKIEILS